MKINKIALVTLASIACTAAQAQSTLTFSDIGSPAASPTGNINTATSFTLGEVINNADGAGSFAGLGTQLFGTVTFSTSSATSFHLNNPTFGTFDSTQIQLALAAPGTVKYNILGIYNSGSFDGGTTFNQPASYTITFTQSPISTGNIADSSIFSIPPVAVPEPGSLALLGMGVGAAWVQFRRRNA